LGRKREKKIRGLGKRNRISGFAVSEPKLTSAKHWPIASPSAGEEISDQAGELASADES
jgi:hypothetical protein